MAQPAEWEMPYLFTSSDCPLRAGRKPITIPDTTQFSSITKTLFGVTCATPDAAYHYGRYNELYLLHLNVPSDREGTLPKKVLARVSRDDKSRSDISLESEIATMVFVRLKTSIPVPKVYGYCPTRNNILGQPFSILSFTDGVDMDGTPWENLNFEAKQTAIRDYARIVLELSRLHFDCIGSIYFKQGASPPNSFRLGEVAWGKHETAARKQHCRYDRGPWKTSSAWLRAALTDEIEFMGRLPDLAQNAYGCRLDNGARWRLAQKILPELRDQVSITIEDPLDGCATGPFVLAHMDLNPWNMIFAPKGPNAGKILSIIDWEMAMTAPLWQLVCYPSWFSQIGRTGKRRDRKERQLFEDTYVRELQQHTRQDTFILRVVQNARSEAKKRFGDVATLPWDAANQMDDWMDEYARDS